MRIRTVKPEFWSHPVLGRLSDQAKLLAVGLLNYADDDGYFLADPVLVRNAIRPFDDDSRITTVALQELSNIGFVELCQHSTHGQIGKVVKFKENQVINKPMPSKIKELFDSGSSTVEIPDSYCGEWNGKEGNGSGVTPLPPKGDDTKHLAKPRTSWTRKQLEAETYPAYPNFQKWWDEYPNGKSKRKSFEAWVKAGLEFEDLESLLTVLDRQKADPEWTKESGAFVPHASTYINQRRFEDDIAKTPAAPKEKAILPKLPPEDLR